MTDSIYLTQQRQIASKSFNNSKESTVGHNIYCTSQQYDFATDNATAVSQ